MRAIKCYISQFASLFIPDDDDESDGPGQNGMDIDSDMADSDGPGCLPVADNSLTDNAGLGMPDTDVFVAFEDTSVAHLLNCAESHLD